MAAGTHLLLREYSERWPFSPSPETSNARQHRLEKLALPLQTGRVYIEKINEPFLYQLKGTPAHYKAGLDRAIANGWLWLHESGTYVKLSGALFARLS